MTRRRKRTIWISVLTAVVLLVGLYLATMMPRISAQRQTEAIAKKAGNLTRTTDFMIYHRQQTYYAVAGYNQKDQLTYVVVNGKTGKIKVLAARRGLTQAAVRAQVQTQQAPQKIYGINLGIDEGQPVWEVATKKRNGRLSYRLVDFYTGKTVDLIDNL
ncbi:cell wall elongation regulator TseB-like domain-containing protein [Lapidilactobacillus salsurivasis]